jgi:diguanylate cyclase (GGDEF)-like protein
VALVTGARRVSRRTLNVYARSVAAGGFCLLGVLALRSHLHFEGATASFWLFAAFVIVGELMPIRMVRYEGQGETTISTTFALALLLVGGVAPAAVALAVGSMVADAAHRKSPIKILFNAGQYVLSVGTASIVLALCGRHPSFSHPLRVSGPDLVAALVAGGAFFVVNNLATETVLGLAEGGAVRARLVRNFPFKGLAAVVQITLSPIAVAAADRSLFLIPLFGLPLVAIYRSAHSLETERLVAKLEDSLGQLEYLALHDVLTNLANRTLFNDRVLQAIATARRTGDRFALMILDLDGFKDVNDTLGHHTGDLLLQEVAGRLTRTLRDVDTVARLGGDEFAVLLPQVGDRSVAAQIAAKVQRALAETVILQGAPVSVGASIGITLFPDNGDSVDVLVQRADVAMYVAKDNRGGYEFYSVTRDGNSPARLALAAEIRQAIDEGQLVLHYQPKADISSGEIVGVEALVRWNHPTRGLVAPNDFVPVAEQSGLIKPLTQFVLDEALRQQARWSRQGILLNVAVNLSVRNLHDLYFVSDVARLLGKWDVEAERLELEITESSVMVEPERAMVVLNDLASMGVRLSIDDFGTGQTSLTYLKRLPVGQVKIDRSFVTNMETDEDDAVIVRSIIDLGHNLGLGVVAEGVEDAATMRTLSVLGCDVAQGWHIGRPVDGETLTRMMAPVRPALRAVGAAAG